jgi:cell division protein ZapA (FtsZ GTPase activity inhibitor)
VSARTIQLDITILGREFKVACKENEREELSEPRLQT